MYCASTRATIDLPTPPFSPPMKWMLLIEFFSLLGRTPWGPGGSMTADEAVTGPSRSRHALFMPAF
jgi:hypothetical protein